MPTLTEAVNLDGGGAVLRQEVRRAQAKLGGDDRPFAILRYAKLRSSASVKGSASHMRRMIPTPNADPDLTPGNEVLVGSTDPAADVLRLVPKEGARDAKGRLRRRSNSVLAVEVMITTSPAWWATATAQDKAQWVADSRAWVELEWGAGNLAHLEIHNDETTPHLTGLIVPLDDEGHLNARAWIGGRAARREPGSSLLSGHQTRYAAAVEPLGLRRGIMGSQARHTTLREHYRRVEAAHDVHGPDIGTPPLLGREKWAQRAVEAVNEHTAILAAKAAELPVERQRRLAVERTAETNAAALEKAKAERRALADQMRALDLGDVLAALGLEEDAKEPGMWKAGAEGERTHRITVKGAKWFDHVAQNGRGGAIDLTAHVLGADFNQALAWLADRFGTAATAATYRASEHDRAERLVKQATQKNPPFTAPAADPEGWPIVRRHLIEDRALPPSLIDAAHEAGDLYAQTRPGSPGRPALRNAVFVQRDEDGHATGAEIKGIVRTEGGQGRYWSGLALGSRKGAGAFRVGAQIAQAAFVAVVESAIDALSFLAEARTWVGSLPVAVISTAGDGDPPPALLAQVSKNADRFAAQDANAAGDRQAERLGEAWERMRPSQPHEDWNDVLVARAKGDGSTPPADEEPATEPEP